MGGSQKMTQSCSWQICSIRFLSSLCQWMTRLLPMKMVLLFLTKKVLSFLPLLLFFFSLTFSFHCFLLKPMGFMLSSSFFSPFPYFSVLENTCLDSQLFVPLFLHVIGALSEQKKNKKKKSLFIFYLLFFLHSHISLDIYCILPIFHAHRISLM